MSAEEERDLRQENSTLREQVRAQQEQIEMQAQQIVRLTQELEALQACLAKDSHNSHLLPSTDRFHRQPKSLRQKSEKKAGGQPGHQGNTLRLVEQPDAVIVHAVEHCMHCQRDLREVAAQQVERRQVVDLPPKRVVIVEHQAEGQCCPACQQVTLASFPQEVPAPVQYGPAFGALAVYLVEQHLLPYERAGEVLCDIFRHSLTVGTLQSLIERCARQLEPVKQQIKTALAQAAVLHQDETGSYVAGKRQ